MNNENIYKILIIAKKQQIFTQHKDKLYLGKDFVVKSGSIKVTPKQCGELRNKSYH